MPGIAHAAPLLPDLLALVVVHARREIVEVGEALVAPVELHGGAQHHPGRFQDRDLGARGNRQCSDDTSAVARKCQRRVGEQRPGPRPMAASRRGPVTGVNGTAFSSFG